MAPLKNVDKDFNMNICLKIKITNVFIPIILLDFQQHGWTKRLSY